MIKNVVLPADTFVVVNKTILSEQDRKIITMLYQPIIGSISTSLFFTLWSYLDKNEILSEQITHHQLMASMKLSLENIIEAREKLEAIGLLKTYFKKGNINTYIYELFSPLSTYEFFENPILNVSLLDNIGNEQYNKMFEYFKIPDIKTIGYENITCSFNEVFMPISKNVLSDCNQIKKVNKNLLDINFDINIDSIFELIPNEMLNKKRITKEIKETIKKLGFIYSLNESELYEVILNSIDDNNLIDIENLKNNCRKYYSFENNGKMPSLIYKSQPENLRKEIKDTSNRSKMIYKFETVSPYDFLYEKNNNTKPSANDLKILEYLLIEQKLNPGVVNVLIDYVLRINNNKLTKSFIMTISSQWVRSNVKTVEEAMNLAEKEYKSKKSYTQTKNIKHTQKKPEWFDKKIEESIVSEEEQKEFENRLKSMK